MAHVAAAHETQIPTRPTQPHPPIECSVLRGHFLMLSEAAARAGVPAATLRRMPGTVVVSARDGSRPTYPEFQFAKDGGFIGGLREAVERVGSDLDRVDLAGWLVAPQPTLGGSSVVEWLSAGHSRAAVGELIDSDLPHEG